MQLDSWVTGSNVLQELVVPVPKETTSFRKRGSSCCGRFKQVLCKQLEELFNNGDNDGDGEGEGGGEAREGLMVPEMPAGPVLTFPRPNTKIINKLNILKMLLKMLNSKKLVLEKKIML